MENSKRVQIADFSASTMLGKILLLARDVSKRLSKPNSDEFAPRFRHRALSLDFLLYLIAQL